jgi:hypothetical protein
MAITERYASVTGAGSNNGTLGNDWTLAQAIAGVSSGQRVNLQAGTYSNTTTNLTWSTAGTSSAPIQWRGYKTTIGDQENNAAAVAGTDIPTITWSGTGHGIVSGAFQTFSNIDFNGAFNGALIDNSSATRCKWLQCRFTTTNTSAGTYCLSPAGGAPINSTMAGCYFSAPTTADAAIKTAGNPIECIGCVFVGGKNAILITSGDMGAMAFCVFDSQGSDAVSMTGYGNIKVIVNCSFYAPGGHGVAIGTTNRHIIVANCHFENVTGAGKNAINMSNPYGVLAVANSYYNCTGTIGGIGDWPNQYDNGTLASSGFSAPGSHNFTPNAVLKAIGFPGKFQNTSLYQGYVDNGAVQRQEPAATTTVIGPFGGGTLITM